MSDGSVGLPWIPNYEASVCSHCFDYTFGHWCVRKGGSSMDFPPLTSWPGAGRAIVRPGSNF